MLWATLDFTQSANAPLSAWEVRRSSVSIDEKNFLTIEATYTPVNKVLSLLAGFGAIGEEINVFSTTVCANIFLRSFAFWRLR